MGGYTLLKDIFTWNTMFEKEWAKDVGDCSVPILPATGVPSALNRSGHSTGPLRAA